MYLQAGKTIYPTRPGEGWASRKAVRGILFCTASHHRLFFIRLQTKTATNADWADFFALNFLLFWE